VTATEPPAVPTLAEYAAAHGLRHRLASFGLPKATQLMRHGFMQEVRSLANGSLPGGLENAWLAQVSYAYEGGDGIERSPFTLVLVEAAKSSSFAVRVLCHDRGLSKRDRANPDADREVIELDDAAVRLESDSFLERYALSTDHDQDQLAVWRLFSPSLIEWLTVSAPAGFSFELQDGALACFRPGFTADPAELDELCAAAARVFARVERIDGDGGGEGGEGGRAETVERELTAHPLEGPPKNTKAAAKAFRRGPFLRDRDWALGAEAFFRAQAAKVGFRPIAPSAFRAGHIDAFLPGVLSHAAQRSLDGGLEAFLVFSDNADYDDMGWSSVVVELGVQGVLLAQGIPRGQMSERGAIQAGSDGRNFILSALDGGARDRSAAEFDAFWATAAGYLSQLGPGAPR
jgi:hypothetical protein